MILIYTAIVPWLDRLFVPNAGGSTEKEPSQRTCSVTDKSALAHFAGWKASGMRLRSDLSSVELLKWSDRSHFVVERLYLRLFFASLLFEKVFSNQGCSCWADGLRSWGSQNWTLGRLWGSSSLMGRSRWVRQQILSMSILAWCCGSVCVFNAWLKTEVHETGWYSFWLKKHVTSHRVKGAGLPEKPMRPVNSFRYHNQRTVKEVSSQKRWKKGAWVLGKQLETVYRVML